MRRRVSRLPSPSLVVALIALFVALGGPALAKVLITGSNIKKGSITAAQIKGNSITGRQINESSLGPVPDANALGGQGAGSFQAASHWALIQETLKTATILAQSGGMSVTLANVGSFLVSDGGSAARKPLSVTLGVGTVGEAHVAPCGGSTNNPGGVDCPILNDNNHVLVQTVNPGATAFIPDATFYITIGGSSGGIVKG